MSVKIKLTFLFTLLMACLLSLFAGFIYWSAAQDRRTEFFAHLHKEAMTRANVLLSAGIDAQTLQTIYMEHREIIHEVEVAIYKPDFTLIYHDAEEIDFVKETPEMIAEIMEQGQIQFTQQGWEVIGLRYYFDQTPYILTAAAYDQYGYSKLRNLRHTLILSGLGAVVLIFFTGMFFSSKALQPVAQMVDKAHKISATNLDLRLNEGNGKDELAELAITFNQLLDRLENSFDAQKEFVSNIAHELRTPLAAIRGEIDLTLSQPRDNRQYQEAMEKIQNDARRISRLSDNLLNLAKASYEPGQISLKELRLDEVVLEARMQLIKDNPEFKVNLQFDESHDYDSEMVIHGNEYLLKVALENLMDNACKYSKNQQATVRLTHRHHQPAIIITDQGTGISEEELMHIFKPFYRGSNKGQCDGSGIGLPLVQRILELHKAEISIDSVTGKGTMVTLMWGTTSPTHIG